MKALIKSLLFNSQSLSFLFTTTTTTSTFLFYLSTVTTERVHTMFSGREMPSPSSLFSAYASMSASIVLCKSMINQLLPHQAQSYILSTLRQLFRRRSSPLATLVIEDRDGMVNNTIYDAAEIYLCTKVSPNAERLKISRGPRENSITLRFAQSEEIVDSFRGIDIFWKFVQLEPPKSERNTDSNKRNGSSNSYGRVEIRLFELSVAKEHKEKILNDYIPFVLEQAKSIREENKVVKIHTLSSGYYPGLGGGGGGGWDSINLQHPSTFETLAMEPDLKREIVEDLDMFLGRKEFYKRVGKAWKRGYLLFGPPGTGKSSLIAAMANYLKFDVYDLQLTGVNSDANLRRLLLGTSNRSILVIEDIDCSVDLPNRDAPFINTRKSDLQFTLSGLLNFLDGLWSSCGDERIIIFTTNNKEKLDPALLRPGRMDKHIHMSYCTAGGFKVLASNYLGINDHKLFGPIQDLLSLSKTSAAEVAEELMQSSDPNVALQGLLDFLKRKRDESVKTELDDETQRNCGVNEAAEEKKEISLDHENGFVQNGEV